MFSVTQAVFIPSYSNFMRYDCSHIEHVCTLYFVHIEKYLFRHYNVYTTFGMLTLFICVSVIQADFIPLYSNLAYDCSHIEDVHRRRRSRAEFGLLQLIQEVFHRLDYEEI